MDGAGSSIVAALGKIPGIVDLQIQTDERHTHHFDSNAARLLLSP